VQQLSSPALYRAVTALWLMMPQTPMFFQGQEFASSSPFFYFADHNPELGKLICAGRANELSQFPSIASPKMLRRLQDPCDESAFERSKLDFSERSKPMHAEMYRLHKDLLKLRRTLPCQRHSYKRGQLDGAVLGSDALLLRYFSDDADWLIVTNFGRDLSLAVAPEPLLAPPAGKRWKMILTTEDPNYGGAGTPAPVTEKEGWHLIGRCTSILKSASPETAEIETRIRPTESH
jgi:maltooligosyltrehalose trehalohydrolase